MDARLTGVADELAILLVFAIVLLPGTVAFFRSAVCVGRILGTLGTY